MTFTHLLEPFQYDYMLTALWVCALIGAVCGLLSGFITLKGWSLMGDALSHAVVPGVALAYLAGLPFSLGAFTSGLLAAAAMSFVKLKTAVREDAVIGVVFTAFFAFGILLISIFPSQLDLKAIVFGNILAIAPGDVVQLVLISVACVLILAAKWRDLLLFSFDPAQARALGLPVRRLHLTLLLLLSATTVAALQAVGAVLVVAMLITPGATAYLLTDRFERMLVIAACVAIGASVFGTLISFHIDGATGPCIVLLQAFVFVLAFLFAPRRGVLALWRNNHSAG